MAKREGYRLMEAPKSRLRAVQRKLLAEILGPVPAHPAAHGFRAEHSCLTYARPHCGTDVVLRMDLRDFFPSIPAPRVHALFETLGYPHATARMLAGLCTNRVTSRMLRGVAAPDPAFRLPWMERKKLELPHLPQGAPTSPALSNLCALHLDLRLQVHHARLAVIHFEPFLARDHRDRGGDAIDAAAYRLAAREREVVGVARVSRAYAFCQRMAPARPHRPHENAQRLARLEAARDLRADRLVRRYCSGMFASLITFAQRAISARIN